MVTCSTIFEIVNYMEICKWQIKSFVYLQSCLIGWLCLASHQQRGHLETAPPFTVPCEERGSWFLHRSHRESNLDVYLQRLMVERGLMIYVIMVPSSDFSVTQY